MDFKENTQIIMFNGNIKLIQNIKPGDKLIGNNSTPRIVKSINSGKDDMYEIVNVKNRICIKVIRIFY